MRKKLVAYFSASQTTKKIAEIIAQVAEADLCWCQYKFPKKGKENSPPLGII